MSGWLSCWVTFGVVESAELNGLRNSLLCGVLFAVFEFLFVVIAAEFRLLLYWFSNYLRDELSSPVKCSWVCVIYIAAPSLYFPKLLNRVLLLVVWFEFLLSLFRWFQSSFRFTKLLNWFCFESGWVLVYVTSSWADFWITELIVFDFLLFTKFVFMFWVIGGLLDDTGFVCRWVSV